VLIKSAKPSTRRDTVVGNVGTLALESVAVPKGPTVFQCRYDMMGERGWYHTAWYAMSYGTSKPSERGHRLCWTLDVFSLTCPMLAVWWLRMTSRLHRGEEFGKSPNIPAAASRSRKLLRASDLETWGAWYDDKVAH